MAPAAIGLGLLGTGLDVIGGINESNARERQLNRQKEDNFIRAEETLEAGRIEERNFRIMARRQIGNLRANISARGVSIKGSGADILAESARAVSFDVQQIQINAKRKSEAFIRGGVQAGAAASDEASSRFFRTIGTIAGGAGDLLKRVA